MPQERNARRATLVALGLVFAASSAFAAEKLRVGRAVPQAFSFVPLDVGMQHGIFKKHGLEIESTSFAGDAKMQQAMAADSIDIALGSGPAMAFIAKGAPVKAVAAFAGRPLLLVLAVRSDGSSNKIADLKGKRVSVSTVGSLTYWLVDELNRQNGWPPGTIIPTPMGALKGQIAALKTKEIDGMVTEISTAYMLEKAGEAKILYSFGDLVKDFHIHVVFASNKLIAERPQAIRAFLAAWFETIAFMRKNKAATVAVAKPVMEADEDVAGRVYDALMPMFSDTGRFDPKALAVLRKSYVELKILDKEPDMSTFYTEAFLPK
jgi:NitT/TauT family transport system substrate-binding protein